MNFHRDSALFNALIFIAFNLLLHWSHATTPAPANQQNVRSTQSYHVVTPRSQEFSHHQHNQPHMPPRVEPTEAPEFTRSTRCLIHNLAEYNNITAECFLVAEHGTVKNRTFTYELVLGNERYQNTSIGKQKACQALAEQAMRRTKYAHPSLGRRTCAVIQSSVSLLQEWAQKRNLTPEYVIVHQELEMERSYTIECTLLGLGLKTQGIGVDKKFAKTIAADQMWDRVQSLNIPMVTGAKSIDQYNTTEAMNFHPVSRIYEIQRARHGFDPVFNVVQRNSVLTANRQNIHIVRMEAKLDNLQVVGQGGNNREAKADAAEKLLKAMGFLVANRN